MPNFVVSLFLTVDLSARSTFTVCMTLIGSTGSSHVFNSDLIIVWGSKFNFHMCGRG